MSANRWAAIGTLLVVLAAGCAVHSQPYNEVSFVDNVTTTNDTFRLQGNLYFDAQAGGHNNYSDVSIVLYDEHRRPIERVSVGRMSTNPEWGPTEYRVNVTAETVPTYVVVESPDFWTGNEIEVDSLVVQNGLVYEYGRGSPDATKFPCELPGVEVNATHCDE